MKQETTPEDLAGLTAAYEFVETMRPQADATNPFPMWYGWALKAAFLAGIKWQKKNSKDSEK